MPYLYVGYLDEIVPPPPNHAPGLKYIVLGNPSLGTIDTKWRDLHLAFSCLDEVY